MPADPPGPDYAQRRGAAGGGGGRHAGGRSARGRVSGPPDVPVYGHHRPTPGEQQPRRPLGRRVAGGIGRFFLDAASARFGTLVVGLVLARMMSPREFGAFGVAVLALLAVQSIGQLEVGSAVVLWRGAPEEIAGTATTISLACSAAVYAACYAGAPAFAAIMGAPAVGHVIRVMALSVVISGMVTAPRAILQRRAPQLRVIVEQIDNWIGVVVTLGLVATGHGLMSLAVGRIAGSLASASLFIAFSPRSLRLGFRAGRAQRLAPDGAAVRGLGRACVWHHQRGPDRRRAHAAHGQPGLLRARPVPGHLAGDPVLPAGPRCRTRRVRPVPAGTRR